MGEFCYGTGFDRVARHMIAACHPEFEVHMYAMRYEGPGEYVDPGVQLHAYRGDISDRYGTRGLAEVVNSVQPQLLVIYYDLPFLRYQLEALRLINYRLPIIAYPALDGRINKRRKLISSLGKLHTCVWFTDFARDQVHEMMREQPSLLDRRVRQEVIYHGLDTSVFHPLEDDRQRARTQAIKQVFPHLPDAENAFIVMNGNRAYPRKRHDLTLRAFAAFAQHKPDSVYLYLHLGSCIPDERKRLQAGAEALGIGARLLMGPPLEDGPVDDARLNLYYNATDVGITTTAGEGWGLVSCEHGAAGIPQIVPRHTSLPEIWQDAALYLEPGPPVGTAA